MAPPPLKKLTAPLRQALFDARVTGPLLFAILYYPERLRSILPAPLGRLITSPGFIQALKVFLGISIVGKLNSKLSQYVVNNGKRDAKFIKSQEVVLITGGSSGIGLVLTKLLSQKGVKVVIVDVNPPKEPLPSNTYFYQGDVTSSAQIASVASEIRKAHGDPTVLVNNAGIGSLTTILGGSEESIRKTFEVNTISHFLTVKEFLPAMIKKNHGHVVTIASMASFVSVAQNVDYSCTKASALAFHEGLAQELKYRYKAPAVRTTIVHPSWTRTPLIQGLIEESKFKEPVLEPEEVAAEIINQLVSGRGGQIILPKASSIVSSARGWPSWLQESLRNQLGHLLDIDVAK